MSTIKEIALVIGLLGFGCLPAAAEVVIVASKDNTTSTLSKAQVMNIFLGRSSHFPGGDRAVPVDQAEASAAHEEFYREVVGWTAAQKKAHWSKLVFTGRGRPPMQVETDQELIEFLVANPSALGYIEEAKVSEHLKVLFYPATSE